MDEFGFFGGLLEREAFLFGVPTTYPSTRLLDISGERIRFASMIGTH